MKTIWKVLLVFALLLCSCTKKQANDVIIDEDDDNKKEVIVDEVNDQTNEVYLRYQELVQNTIDYSHSLSIWKNDCDIEYEYTQFISDGNEDLGIIDYFLHRNIEDKSSFDEGTLSIPGDDQYDQYKLDHNQWKYDCKTENELSRYSYFDVETYTIMISLEAYIDVEHSSYDDNSLCLVYDYDDCDVEINVTIENDRIKEMEIITFYGVETGQWDDAIIKVEIIDDIGEEYYNQQVNEAKEYTNRPIEDSIDLVI